MVCSFRISEQGVNTIPPREFNMIHNPKSEGLTINQIPSRAGASDASRSSPVATAATPIPYAALRSIPIVFPSVFLHDWSLSSITWLVTNFLGARHLLDNIIYSRARRKSGSLDRPDRLHLFNSIDEIIFHSLSVASQYDRNQMTPIAGNLKYAE